MRLMSIASGSSGNCIYIGDENTHILVDTGISKKKIDAGLSEIGLSGADIDAVLVTHEHIDHIKGLGVFARKYNAPIFATEGTIEGIKCCSSVGLIDTDLYNKIQTDIAFKIGTFTINPFKISHDANEPSAYRISNGDKTVAVATDLGKYDEYTIDNLKDLNAVVLEANHDIKMLEVGPYPYQLKKRVASDRGHLSNENTGRLLCQIANDKLECVLLGHLSKDNNYPDLAYETVKLEMELESRNNNISIPEVIVANRDIVSKVVNL
ncbi:MAG: MBL fold metallo-hydrolase [Lachnospiraceae bacterium]|jgi:phosphoribosyl 1,2-cyclic phosphodiesterase|nr:MBL fold metallo-hydrolase [Lachnospiraceae bacterium]